MVIKQKLQIYYAVKEILVWQGAAPFITVNIDQPTICHKEKVWSINIKIHHKKSLQHLYTCILQLYNGIVNIWVTCTLTLCHFVLLPAPSLSPPTCTFLVSGRGAHGDRQGALWQVWAGAIASNTVHFGEEIPAHLLAGTTLTRILTNTYIVWESILIFCHIWN